MIEPAIAGEALVHAASRPGYVGTIEEWLSEADTIGIRQALVLTSCEEIEEFYARGRLLEVLRSHFGEGQVTHVPWADFGPVPAGEPFANMLPAIERAVAAKESVVVFCGSGIGRTGLLTACWAARSRDVDAREAARLVSASGRRDPFEERDGMTQHNVLSLIERCRPHR